MKIKPSIIDVTKNVYKRGGIKSFYAVVYFSLYMIP